MKNHRLKNLLKLIPDLYLFIINNNLSLHSEIDNYRKFRNYGFNKIRYRTI